MTNLIDDFTAATTLKPSEFDLLTSRYGAMSAAALIDRAILEAARDEECKRKRAFKAGGTSSELNSLLSTSNCVGNELTTRGRNPD